MSLDVYSRRKYKQGKFVYLLDDEEKTAWIDHGYIGTQRSYCLPDHITIKGERYTVESVELGAYNHPTTLEHLVIPDTFIFVDCDTLYGLENLRSIHIGKRLESLNSWNFRCCPKLQDISIDKDNPHIKYEDGMVWSKDGKKLLATFFEHQHLVIPEGVEEIKGIVFMDDNKLESVTFPKTLRRICGNCFCNCPNLRKVVLPKGFEEFEGGQNFMENTNLTHIDLPSTLTNLGYQTFVDCPNLETIVLRPPKKLDFEDCFGAYLHEKPMTIPYLYVPAALVGQYQQDKEWCVFKNILPIL